MTDRQFTKNVKRCTVPGCDGEVSARGWCIRHYTRWKRHGDPEAVTRTPPIAPGAVDKFCPRCKVTKPLTEYRIRTRTGSPSGYCVECMDDYTREYIATENGRKRKRTAAYRWKSSNRDYTLQRLYGMTSADYDQLLAVQGGSCAICRATEPGGQSGYFHIDHCHQSKKVRGLLCTRCNMGLGLFRDDSERLLAAVAYLKPS